MKSKFNIFRFIDDVEFYLTEQGVIHFRSASRIGHSDLGVNRRRVEMIRITFNNINKTFGEIVGNKELGGSNLWIFLFLPIMALFSYFLFSFLVITICGKFDI